MVKFRPASKYMYPNDMCELIRTVTDIIEKKHDVEVDKKQLWDIVNNIYEQWINVSEIEKEEDKKDYYKLISFFTLLLSTNWFNEDQNELEDLVNEIYFAHMGLAQTYPEEELTRAIENSLGAEVKKCIINKNDLSVEFIKGDYGDGIFDGKIVLDLNEGLFLHTQKDVLQYTGKLPVDAYEIELAISSFDWKQRDEKKKE
ncbi:hypothetical protein PGSY75_1118000 [Plasmodium gaboni]|uniref:Uncharacterized protein n=1 Tax=Plasmodium gaboni TaxID=647221 RepID=A0A151LIL1_9APIC|nr:hypothetical protein PGSY75_1118000 [Plasmodium gaboni]KYN98820.1 hypothetical protein PGSY75_1118000 [Plasmodium gaboni]SOV23257.1 conserved Plasmodium protein, unknown function [Plasmodium sp. DRC-Itaito]